ncbi:unnamed protein product [Clonostachys rosea]|uniref:F-box domain-containing protein n=1 Tax=Bionectria ochroleuca TaxID=29856 RepID=A0ABY6V4S0_BIOOC|nr:unnamed protein product [Clonostachys rosea]
MPSQDSPILRLPIEITGIITSSFTQSDLKNLRLTCLSLSKQVQPRLSRVFLSANPLNVSVFRAIADHDRFRHGVSEIVWDDARLDVARRALDHDLLSNLPDEELVHDMLATVPEWFYLAYRDNVRVARNRRGLDADTTESKARAAELQDMLPLCESWSIYQGLLRQQHEVIASGADIEAFRYGLERFPSLRSVRVTPAAHGWLFQPLYRTPMIRQFPRGFNYAIPRGWPVKGVEPVEPTPGARHWHQQEHKDRWRGVCAAMHELAQIKAHRVEELIIDAHGLGTGLDCRIFDSPDSPEYYDLITFLRQWPQLRRLDLDLHVEGQPVYKWPSFRSGYLRSALSQAAEGLEHISLGIDGGKSEWYWYDMDNPLMSSEERMRQHVPLAQIFPHEKWTRLRHFGLSGLWVTTEDLLMLLAALPQTLKSVELSFLWFLGPRSIVNYRSLVYGMRALEWCTRPAAQQPRVCIGVQHDPLHEIEGRRLWVAKEVNDCIYHGGENPFTLLGGHMVAFGVGHLVDAFDSSYTRPWLTTEQYAEQGIYKPLPAPGGPPTWLEFAL